MSAERLPKFAQSGPDSRLDRSEGLIQTWLPPRNKSIRRKNAVSITCRFFGVRTSRAFRRRRLCSSNWPSFLWVIRCSRCNRIVRIAVDGAFFPLFESQPVNRPRARLIHDPSDDGSAGRIVSRRSSPNVVEDIQAQFFGGFPVVRYPDDQRKNDSMRLCVKRMQCKLIASGNGSDDPDPCSSGNGTVALFA